MSRTVVLLLLAALALQALGLRRQEPAPQAGTVAHPLAVGSADAEQDAWRLRLVELALATGRAAHHDRFLDAPQGRAVPWPVLFPASLAALARRTTFSSRDPLELGSVEQVELLALVAHVLPVLGALGALAAFLLARAVHGGAAADLAGLCAAGLWTFLPSIVVAESAWRVDPHALTALLSLALLGATCFALRAREDVDATLGGLAAGVTAGLGLACSVEVVPVLVAALVAFGVAAVRRRPGVRRALLLCVVAGAVVTTMGLGRDTSWSALIPSPAGWLVGGRADALRYWPAAVLAPLTLAALAAGWRRRERFVTAILLLSAMVWASLFDPGAAGVHVAVVVGAAVACADVAERLQPRWRALAVLALAIVAAPALSFRLDAYLKPSADQIQERQGVRAGLLWMRANLPSAGPWNHPEAGPDWWVLAPPSVGASVACWSRRPVLSAALPGVPADATRARNAAQLLAGPADAAQVEALRVLGVRYVVAGAALAEDPWMQEAAREAGAETFFERLSRDDPGLEGLERLWPVQDGAPLSVWRLAAGSESREPPSLRAR